MGRRERSTRKPSSLALSATFTVSSDELGLLRVDSFVDCRSADIMIRDSLEFEVPNGTYPTVPTSHLLRVSPLRRWHTSWGLPCLPVSYPLLSCTLTHNIDRGMHGADDWLRPCSVWSSAERRGHFVYGMYRSTASVS